MFLGENAPKKHIIIMGFNARSTTAPFAILLHLLSYVGKNDEKGDGGLDLLWQRKFLLLKFMNKIHAKVVSTAKIFAFLLAHSTSLVP